MKTTFHFIFAPLLIGIIIITSCEYFEPELTVETRHILKHLPSASGTSLMGGSIWVIGDDSPWIYQLNKAFKIQSKLRFGDYILQADSVIAKQDKPDLEALTAIKYNGKKELWAFGSGSLSPQRDVLIQIEPDKKNKVTSYSLKKNYNRLRSASQLKGYELNIEGAAVDNNYLYLLNRDNNLLLRYSLSDFIAFVTENGTYPKPKIYKINLPKIDGIEAGFSGATMLTDENKIIFTASVEDTPNSIDDGEILGSFVGIIDLNKLDNELSPTALPVIAKDSLLKLKVESVSVLNHTPGKTELILVTDSDGGDSEIIESVLHWN